MPEGFPPLTRIDERWFFYTTGRPKGLEFDGLLPAWTTVYPGTTLGDVSTNLRLRGYNHVDMTWRCEGVNEMADRMVERVGMKRTGSVLNCAPGGGGGGGGEGGCVDCLLPVRPGLGSAVVGRPGPGAPGPRVRKPAGEHR